MALVAARSRANARDNPAALRQAGSSDVSGVSGDEASAESEGLSAACGNCLPAIRRGAAAGARLRAGRRRAAVVILAAGERARELCGRPAWITGFEHRIDSASLGARDLTTAPSAAAAGKAAGASRAQVAELHAPFTHQEIILRPGTGPRRRVNVNPSGGALCGNPMFAAGLARIGSAAIEIINGRADVALGQRHQRPALQQN